MPALSGLGAALVAAGVILLAREGLMKVDPVVEALGLGAVLVGIGTALLDVGISG